MTIKVAKSKPSFRMKICDAPGCLEEEDLVDIDLGKIKFRLCGKCRLELMEKMSEKG